MSKRGENIRKRKDGRWEGRYKRGVKEDGTTQYASVYGKTYNEVKEKLLNAKINQENLFVARNNERFFSDILILWFQSNKIRLKGSSKQRYEYLINTHILPELGGLKASQINASRINTFLAQKLSNGRVNSDKELSPSYVNSIAIIIKSAIDYAIAEQICPPLKTRIYKPKIIKNELKILNSEEQAAIEKYTRNNLNATGIGVIISLYSGLRIGEICALTWDDIDLDNQILHVRHTIARVKNEKNRTTKTALIIDEPKTKASKRDIPISTSLMNYIIEYKKNTVSKYLVSENLQFISPRTFEYRYHRLLDSCGVKSINFHALRHTFASRCVEAGVDIKSLSEILGHQDSSITLNTYVHTSMAQKRAQLDKLSSIAIS